MALRGEVTDEGGESLGADFLELDHEEMPVAGVGVEAVVTAVGERGEEDLVRGRRSGERLRLVWRGRREETTEEVERDGEGDAAGEGEPGKLDGEPASRVELAL